MNPNTPYNTEALQNMVAKVKAYCAHIIPLVFDNTLSYYESICACVGKVNELCDAVNAQNLTIVEFTHLVEVELDKLSKYIDEQITSFDTRITANEENIHTLTVRTDNQELVLQNIGEWREWANRQLSDIRDVLATCLKQTDITDTITDGDTTHVPTADAVYDAIQNATGVTVRDAQANPTHGTIKGIVTTDFQQLANPLSITNGVMSMREATKNVTGYVQIGDNINVTNGVIDVPLASPTAKGLVMASNVDSGITAYNGTMRVNVADPLYIDTQHNRVDVKYATNTQLGVVAPKLGGALDIQSAGEIDAKDATTTQKGVVTLTDTITDGDSTHVPTADAVYEALQQGSGGTVPDATTTTKGKVQIGDNISVSSGVISVPFATQYTKGVVQAGDNIEIANGAISVPDATQSKKGVVMLDATVTQSSGNVPTSGAVYDAIQSASGTVPDATTTTKGKVQIGDNINVSNGVISVPDASTLTKGVMTVGSGLVANQGLVYVAQATDSAIGGVKIGDGLKNDTNDKLTIDSDATLAINQSGKLTVRTATPDNVGLATIDGTNSNLTMAYGKIDVPTGSANTKGVLQVGSNINVGNGVISVPTATPGTLGVTTIADTGSNLTMGAGGVIDVPTGSLSTKGVLKVNKSNGLTVSDGTVGINRADEVTFGTVMIGDNISSNNGEISVPDATTNTAGVVTLDDTVTQSSDNVPTSEAVYNAITSMLQNGGFSRTLQLEHNSNPDGGAECIVVLSTSDGKSVMPDSSNIINANDVNNTRINFTSDSDGYLHVYIKTSLYPNGLDYNSQMKSTTIDSKSSQYLSYWNNSIVSNARWGDWNIGDTFTNNFGTAYRHLFISNRGNYIYNTIRVKIDY